MDADLRARIIAYNRAKKATEDAKAALEAQLAAETDKLRTVANLFSASVWRILPDGSTVLTTVGEQLRRAA